jgi:hypothetical protein
VGTVNPNRTGLILGTLAGGWHVIWALLVAAGWAQTVINFVFWAHFVAPAPLVQPFHGGVAVLLIVVTAALGYVVGYILGVLWNWIHR